MSMPSIDWRSLAIAWAIVLAVLVPAVWLAYKYSVKRKGIK